MPTVDGIHRSPLWPDTGPEVIAINEIAERNHWCMTSQNVQAQRKKKEGRTKCQSSINALLSDVGIVLSQNVSPEPGVLLLLLIFGISFPSSLIQYFLEPVWPLWLFPNHLPGSFTCLDFKSLLGSFSWWVLILFYKGGKKINFLITRGIPTHTAFWKLSIKLN